MPSLLLFLGTVIGLLFYQLNLIFYLFLLVLVSALVIYRFGFKKSLFFFGAFAISLIFILLIQFVPIKEKTSLSGMVIETSDNYFILQSGFRRYYIALEGHAYEKFDFIQVDGKMHEVDFRALESRFDFRDYLFKKGLNYVFETNNITSKLRFFIRPNAFRKQIVSSFDPLTNSYVSAFIFNKTDYQLQSTRFASNYDLSHLFGLSGLYLYSLLRLIEYFLRLKFPNKTVKIFSLFFLLIVLIITSFSFLIFRILLVRLLRFVNEYHLKKRYTNLTIISISSLIPFIFDPFLLFSPSYFISTIIIFFFNFTPHLFRKITGWKRKILNIFLIFLLLIPYNLINNQSFSLLTLILQPLFILFGFVSFYVSLLSLLHIPFTFYFAFVEKMFFFFESGLKGNTLMLLTAPFNEWFVLIYYALYIGTLYLLQLQNRRIYFVPIVAIPSLILGLTLPFEKMFNEGSVHFINVGQGDATLIKSRYANILIDTGGSYSFDISEEVIIPFLKKQRVYQLDYLIITHHDFDHNGGVETLQKNYKVKNTYDYANFQSIKLGDSEIVNLNTYFDFSQDENYNSLVLNFELNNQYYLLMGDAPKAIENKIITDYDIQCDVLKVGHHGSNTSTGAKFLDAVAPQKAIISCGYKNRYGHPHQEVIALLNKHQIKIYRTDYDGTIQT